MLLKTRLDIERDDAARVAKIESLATEISELTVNLGEPTTLAFNANVEKLAKLTKDRQTLQDETTDTDGYPEGERRQVRFVDSLHGRVDLITKLQTEIRAALDKTTRAIDKRESRVNILTAYVKKDGIDKDRAARAQSHIDKFTEELPILQAARDEYQAALPTAKRRASSPRQKRSDKQGQALTGEQHITVNHVDYTIPADVVKRMHEVYAGRPQQVVNDVLIKEAIIPAEDANHAWNAVARIVGHLTPAQQRKIEAREKKASDTDKDAATDNKDEATDNKDAANAA